MRPNLLYLISLRALMKKTGRRLFTTFQTFLASLFGTECVLEAEASTSDPPVSPENSQADPRLSRQEIPATLLVLILELAEPQAGREGLNTQP